MQLSERGAFFQLMLKTAMFYEKTLANDIIDVYWEDLENYEIQDIKTALVLHRQDAKRGRYMPKTADIVCHLQNAKRGNVRNVDFKHFHCSSTGCTNAGTMSHSPHGEAKWVCRQHYLDPDYIFEVKPSSRPAEIVNLVTVAKRSDSEPYRDEG